MVYIARKNGRAVHHTSLEAMKQMDGIDTPELSVPDAEFEAAGGLVRIIGGKITLGKTQAEIKAEAKNERRDEIERELKDIDAKSGRAARSAALAVSGGKTPAQSDVQRLEELEAQAAALRAELKTLAA